MIRDFTQATKNRLLKQIDDINKKTWNPVTDFIGDLFLHGGKLIGVLSLKDDLSNVESYQRKVLDMSDYKKKDIKKIFDKVYSIDKKYQGLFLDVADHQRVFNDKIKMLSGLIQPNFSISDAKTIKALSKDFNNRLKDIDKGLNASMEKELNWAAKRAALKATKGTITSIIDTAFDIVLLPVTLVKDVATLDFASIVSDTWGLINDCFSIGGNLVGLVGLGLGLGIGALQKSNRTKNEAVKVAELYGESGGLSDVLEADDKLNGRDTDKNYFLKASKTVDTVDSAYSIYSGAQKIVKGKGFSKKGFIDYKFGYESDLKTLKKADMAKKYQDDYRDWQKLYRHVAKDNHYVAVKNIKNTYEMLSPIGDLTEGKDKYIESQTKAVYSKFDKVSGLNSKSYSFGEDVIDLYEQYAVSPVGG